MKIVNETEWKEIVAEINAETIEDRVGRMNSLHKIDFGEPIRGRKRKGYKVNPIFKAR